MQTAAASSGSPLGGSIRTAELVWDNSGIWCDATEGEFPGAGFKFTDGGQKRTDVTTIDAYRFAHIYNIIYQFANLPDRYRAGESLQVRQRRFYLIKKLR